MKKIIPIIILVLALCQAGASGVRADDTDIYGTTTISVRPNVLIIFDTSGSMSTEDVPGDLYNPATTYAGAKTTNAVYRYSSGSYTLFTGDVNNIICPSIKTALQTTGYKTGLINTTTFDCGNKSRQLRLGNWINYDTAGGAWDSRISVARDAIKNLINTTGFQDDGTGGGIANNGIQDGGEVLDVRFGLMRFNNDQGGRVVKSIGSTKADLISAVDALTASGWTPLAETTAEAGLYYAGKASWFNSGVTYTSPIENRCQKNYIILMTDGEPTMDSDSKLINGAYINGDYIADYDNDGSSGKLDDVAKYLYDNDIRSDLGVPGESFERQNIITYTIGFTSDQTLLQATATNGGGRYYTTSSASGLTAAFEEIMSEIADVNAVFVSPVVPVSRMSRAYAGNRLYVGFFKPNESGRWDGNIKKYGLNSAGEIVDKNGILATNPDSGAIKDNATSYWSTSPDGPSVLAGGAGGVLSEQTTRHLYTNVGTTGVLTHSTNAFSKTNSNLAVTVTPPKNLMEVTDNTEKDRVIDDIYGADRGWILGDILHSQPAVIHYSATSTFIFAGSNDGMMHCFNDESGTEEWGFIPIDQLSRLQKLSNAETTHDYFVDGAPVVWREDGGANRKILFFGERRGGYNYYGIDVTTAASPEYLYTIEPGILSELLGQSFCTPAVAKIKINDTESRDVFLMAGGYDINQDLDTPAADSQGRAIFTVDVISGAPVGLNVTPVDLPDDMKHCILDVAGFDTDGNGIVNKVYAGDLGGKVFAVRDHYEDGTWSARTLFSPPADGLKIFYAPTVTLESFDETIGEMVFFGTGDREHPMENTVVNRLYAIKNKWGTPASTLHEGDLTDVTADWIQVGDAGQKQTVIEQLEASDGWYIDLENLGEKVVSSPVVYAGVVYFTTYTPEAGGGGDECEAASGVGEARLYALDYKTGAAVFHYAGRENDPLVKADRHALLGSSMPSEVVIAVLEGGAKMFVGVEGGIADPGIGAARNLNMFYWRQITN